MKIVEINNYRDFLSLEMDWASILSKARHTVFSTWEWLSTWWKHFGDNKKLMLLLVEESGNFIGIAPLMYSVNTMFGLRRGKIEFIGAPHSDYTSFILTEKKEECLTLFKDHLFNIPEKWECIDLSEIPESAECLPFLAKNANFLSRVHKCPYLPLPNSYDLFMKKLNHHNRHALKKSMRRLEKVFKVEIVDYSKTESCNEGMFHLIELHEKRWKSKGFAGAFDNPRFRDFHLDIAKSFSQKNWLFLRGLKLSGNLVAMQYGFKYQSKIYGYLSGFDPKYRRYGVGQMLQLYNIRNAIQEKLTGFDFMRGAEEYKDRWKTIARWNYRAVLTRQDRISHIQHWLFNKYWLQGNKLQYFLGMKQ